MKRISLTGGLIAVLALTLAVPAHAISGWTYAGRNGAGKNVWKAVKYPACIWVNTSEGSKITSRAQITGKRPGDTVVLDANQGVSDC